VEPLRRAALEYQQGAHRPLGPFRSSPAYARIWPVGLSDIVVVFLLGAGRDRHEALMPKHCLFANYSLSAALTAPVVVRRAPACDRHIEHQSIEANS
jgi:hypothetical protein